VLHRPAHPGQPSTAKKQLPAKVAFCLLLALLSEQFTSVDPDAGLKQAGPIAVCHALLLTDGTQVA
jgi:hypothetical protein